ncbi:unnamed protein product [Symbiodinium natans]|uniref:WKF domain-containing protein n=1 Tax=Symbiodinium natans TaxID=878477 RepID=A0A812TZ63_9DINO|nr:unnamed protein product [Symbiodinium natans]
MSVQYSRKRRNDRMLLSPCLAASVPRLTAWCSKHVAPSSIFATPEVEKEQPVREKKDSPKSQARTKRAKHKRRKPARDNAKTKDPEEASSYLTAWQAHQDVGTPWRFNKATQAWLLRHAYEPELVPKQVFRILLRYLAGLSGVARDRALAEASTLVTLKGSELAKVPTERERSLPGDEPHGDEQEDRRDPSGNEEEAKKCRSRLARARQVLQVLGHSEPT